MLVEVQSAMQLSQGKRRVDVKGGGISTNGHLYRISLESLETVESTVVRLLCGL